ncbi:MAG: glycosyltransferase family 2 protein [Halioglobus sp.]
MSPLKNLSNRLRKREANEGCELSIILVAYDMAREMPRTLHSLSAGYQQAGRAIDYEVIVVDNGSPEPLAEDSVLEHGEQFRLLRIDDASPSPAAAINAAVVQSQGRYVGIIVDGARMLSPGVLRWARACFSLEPRSVASVLGFHLGPEHQRLSSARGYNQRVEDRLLDRIGWPENPYKLFEIAALAGSSKFGWYGPIAESNCVFLQRELFDEIGGYEERFDSPGGGMVNLDFYKRACEAGEVSLYYLVGEGCFHQIHGGVTTGGKEREASRYDSLHGEYQTIRGEKFTAPTNHPILIGHSRLAATWLVAEGSGLMVTEYQLDRRRTNHMKAVGLDYEFHDESKYAEP